MMDIGCAKVMSVIYRTGQTFGAHHVIGVLRGLNNQKFASLIMISFRCTASVKSKAKIIG
ncbi:ATP-dependent DNA helicase [Actinobacillus equuli]|nr:ATP-dependent DNA helicase [Actinobacillus equuli]